MSYSPPFDSSDHSTAKPDCSINFLFPDIIAILAHKFDQRIFPNVTAVTLLFKRRFDRPAHSFSLTRV